MRGPWRLRSAPSLPQPRAPLVARCWESRELAASLAPLCLPPPVCQGGPLGPLPGPAGAQPQVPLCLTCFLVNPRIRHPCFLHLSPSHLPHCKYCSINMLTLVPRMGTSGPLGSSSPLAAGPSRAGDGSKSVPALQTLPSQRRQKTRALGPALPRGGHPATRGSSAAWC